jgi:hypothetical protein
MNGRVGTVCNFCGMRGVLWCADCSSARGATWSHINGASLAAAYRELIKRRSLHTVRVAYNLQAHMQLNCSDISNTIRATAA